MASADVLVERRLEALTEIHAVGWYAGRAAIVKNLEKLGLVEPDGPGHWKVTTKGMRVIGGLAVDGTLGGHCG